MTNIDWPAEGNAEAKVSFGGNSNGTPNPPPNDQILIHFFIPNRPKSARFLEIPGAPELKIDLSDYASIFRTLRKRDRVLQVVAFSQTNSAISYKLHFDFEPNDKFDTAYKMEIEAGPRPDILLLRVNLET